ncbi:hypothetical protein [Dyadobacter sp.]|uniref:hypothetical protein n=1 Tax=Dyadobacter sp. TaxID=1914288 RepID=UPI003F72F69A
MNSSKKQWIGLGLLMLMLVKAWVIPLVCLDYEIRKDYISKALCINRDRPKLNCNGKCYLAKKLAEAEKQQERQAQQDYMSSLIYQVMDSSNSYAFGLPQVTLEDYPTPAFFYKSAFLGRIAAESIFHPPLA